MIKRKEFIDRLSKKGYTKKDAGIIVDDLVTTIEEALIEGDSVSFHGFGTFEITERAAKNVTDIHTKEIRTVPPYKAVKFVVGKALKRAIREGFIRK